MATYQAIIFDLGKVVFDLSFDQVFHCWAKAANRSYDELKSRFQFNETFDQFEKNELTPAAFRAKVSRQFGLTLPDQEFDAGWCALYLDPYDGIAELLASLRQRYQLVALTNTNRIHSQVWPVKYADLLANFQRVFSSHELGQRKPDAAAYQLVLDYLQLAPAQVVFLDDNEANIHGANQLGIKTILVTSIKQMTRELGALGLLT